MEKTTIRALFRDQDRRFEIPTYQRAYSWGEKQIDQLLQDLRDAGHDYYLGHFLFQQNLVQGKAAANTLLIIDGQQRLTTCVIFFSCLHHELTRRRIAGESVSIDLDDLMHMYLRDTRKGTQKLETVRDDNNFFAVEIVDGKHSTNGQPSTRSQVCIREARERIAIALVGASLKDLERWHELVADAKCTEYRVNDTIDAARIFAFQNDRGKRLSDLEVLKSYFMLQVYLHGGMPEVVNEHLKYLEVEISTIYHQIVRVDLGEDEVLRYCWQSFSASKGFDTRNTIEEIKTYVTSGESSGVCARIREFMSAFAKAFQLVESIENGPEPEVINLRYLDTMALAYPFFMRAHHHGASPKQHVRLARLLENVTFRALLRGGRAGIGSRLNHYLRLPADAGYVDTVVEGVVRDLRAGGEWWYWSDHVLEHLDDGYFYQNRVDNYVLWRYEMHLCAQSGYPPPLKVTYSDLIKDECIEHIAPRTESPGVPIANGYGIYEDAQYPTKGIASGEWLNCLGNLLLINRSHNSSIGNTAFANKLASYGAANLLNQQKEIGGFVTDPSNPVWDQAAIERRHAKLIGVATKFWSLDNL